MTERIRRSEAAQAICAEHWDGKDSGCAKCPIRAACHSGPTANLTYERMDEHMQRVNDAAAAVTVKDGAPK